MDSVLDTLIQISSILGEGGFQGIIILLLAMIGGLIWDRQRLLKSLDKKEEKIEKIIEDYHKGNLTLSEALNNVRIVLFEIKGKL